MIFEQHSQVLKKTMEGRDPSRSSFFIWQHSDKLEVWQNDDEDAKLRASATSDIQ